MSQHDYNIANQLFPSFRADLNSVLAAIMTMNSGTTAPSVTAPGMMWYDTDSQRMKIRSSDDSTWTVLFELTSGDVIFISRLKASAGNASSPGISFSAQDNSGLYVADASSIAMSVLGTKIGQFYADKIVFSKQVTANGFALSSASNGFSGYASDGSSNPSYRWADEATGFFRSGTGNIGFASVGVKVATMGGSAFTPLVQILSGATGSVSQPNYSFNGAGSSGMWLDGSGHVAISRLGSKNLVVTDTEVKVPNGVKFSGSGDNLTSLNSVVVATAYAGVGAQNVGSIAMFTKKDGGNVLAGSNYNGSDLYRMQIRYNIYNNTMLAYPDTSTVINGTWKALGRSNTDDNNHGMHLFIRIE